MASPGEAKQAVPKGKKPAPPPNTASICDYNHSVLSDVIKGVKVGQKVSLVLDGEVNRLEEYYRKPADKYDTYSDRCEIGLTPTSVRLSSAKAAPTMADQMKKDGQRRAGQYDYGEEEEG